MAPRYELAVGMKRGHKTTKIERVGKVSGKELSAKSEKLRQARTKGVSNVKYNSLHWCNIVCIHTNQSLIFFFCCFSML